MALDETSTYDEIVTERQRTAAYFQLQDVAMAGEYITASQMYVDKLPQQAGHQSGEQIAFDVRAVKESMDDAKAFLSTAGGIDGAPVIHPDLTSWPRF